MTTAAQIMTPRPDALGVRQSIRSAMGRLAELDVRHLPVVDDGELVGIVSDRDLRGVVSRLLSEGSGSIGALLERPVSEIMSSDVIAVDPETDVGDVIDLLVENRIGAVPVVTPEQDLIGIVSYVDVLKAARREG